MRMSDWSSDVCSSDLQQAVVRRCQPGFQYRMCRADAGMAGERHLVARAEDAQPVVGVGRGGGEDEGGFGQARPARDRLHGVVVETLRVVHDGKRIAGAGAVGEDVERSEEHTHELQSLMSISYAVFCLTKKTE